jgi:hypothetical protein
MDIETRFQHNSCATIVQNSRDTGGSHHMGLMWDPLHTTVVQETFLTDITYFKIVIFIRIYRQWFLLTAACMYTLLNVTPSFKPRFPFSKSTSSSYPILVSFPIFKENFIKNIKKPTTADTLYLDEGVGNE